MYIVCDSFQSDMLALLAGFSAGIAISLICDPAREGFLLGFDSGQPVVLLGLAILY